MSTWPKVLFVSSTRRCRSSFDEMLAGGFLARRDDYLGALLRHPHRDRTADAARGTGDDGDFTAQVEQ
jgi:hypothetical protein